jgi:hypothetical protein
MSATTESTLVRITASDARPQPALERERTPRVGNRDGSRVAPAPADRDVTAENCEYVADWVI